MINKDNQNSNGNVSDNNDNNSILKITEKEARSWWKIKFEK